MALKGNIIFFLLLISTITWTQEASTPHTFKQIIAKVEVMTEATTYYQIIETLGQPYEKFATPSLPEEYVLYFNVPDEPQYMYWIMLDTENKTFLYWSQQKTKKQPK